MGFDKAKVVRAAEKYLSQGKIPAAIKEYRQIVENDADDFTALNMLGDLYVRTDKKPEAIACFTRIAEHYREQGFALKAIAMFKKIDKLDPHNIEIARNLATLYEMQGLIVDARAQYLFVADALTHAGRAQDALNVLRKIADFEPNNTETRLKLAEGYQREGMRAEAAEAYSEAGTRLLGRGVAERALDAFQRALDLRPHDRAALQGLLDAHIALGTADEAAEILEREVEAHPGDIELLSMLAEGYIQAQDARAAERAVSALVQSEAANYARFADVARLYLKDGDVNAATRVLGEVSEQMLAGREERVFQELVEEALARDPEHIEALRLLARAYTWQHDDEKLRPALERLVEAAQSAGLADEERIALASLVRLAPDRPEYFERLKELGGAPEESAPEAATDYEMVGGTEPPSFESFALVDEYQSTVDELQTATSKTSFPPTEESLEFEWNTVSSPSDSSNSFADLNDWSDTSAQTDFSDVAQPAPSSNDFQSDLNEGGAGADNRREAMLRQELESVDFYLAQGYNDIALDTLEMLERQFGVHAEITARRARLNSGEPAATPPAPDAQEPATFDFSSFTDSLAMDDDAPSSAVAAPPVVEFAMTPIAQPEPTAQHESSHPQASTKQESGIDPGLAAIFDEFRTAVEDEEPPASDGDYETHYNLGLAYKDMDLLDEAIEEFQLAAGLVSPQDGTPRYLQCCNLLGHCFLQKEMPRLAIMWFKKGLDAPGHSEDEYQALRYELGTAYEQMGDLDGAIEIFSEVYGVSVTYRGVADKLKELRAQRAVKQ